MSGQEAEEVRGGCHWNKKTRFYVRTVHFISTVKKSNVFFLKKLLIDKLQFPINFMKRWNINK
jgi:hypothetical protein